MRWRICARSIAVGSLGLMAAIATDVSTGSAHAQAMQATNFSALDPQWALASPFMSAGSNFNGANNQFYTARLGSGTVGLFTESRDYGVGAFGPSSNLFGTSMFSPMAQRQNMFAGLGAVSSSNSVYGAYKSDLGTGLFSGLYSTASFGVTSVSTAPAFTGLPGFTAGNDAVAVSAKAGVGLQITPNISIEGSVGFTQMQGSAFR